MKSKKKVLQFTFSIYVNVLRDCFKELCSKIILEYGFWVIFSDSVDFDAISIFEAVFQWD